MSKTVGVKFNENGKVYDFDAGDLVLRAGDHVIVETSKGVECGEVAEAPHPPVPGKKRLELKPVIRAATPDDLKILEENRQKAKKAFAVCEKKIEAYKLNMTLVEVDYSFDGSKISFFYTAPARVDFRELVRDLAGTFRSRIELRQIGVRDETRMIGGLGICGMPFCCSRFLNDFHPVSIKMAKEQGMSINSAKISGACGRLMCCLAYEEDAYKYLLKITPKVGAIVETPDGRGVVTDNNLLTGKLSVRLDKKADAAPAKFDRTEVRIIRDGEIKIDKKELDEAKKLQD